MNKTVSVIIPTYNRPNVLFNSIKTVLEQTFPGSIEIIVIDDSKESLEQEILKKFGKKTGKYREIVYIHKGKKEGAPIARNIGIKKSKGEYIAFLDDDDTWMPYKIEKQVKILDENHDVALVVCYSIDKRFGRERVSRTPEIISHDHILKSFNLSSSSSYLVRKKVVEELNGFDINLPSAQEYDLAIRISKKYGVHCVTKVLMIQNATEGQISENWKKKIRGLWSVYHKHRKDYNSSSIFNAVKLVGMLGLFSMGFIVGNRIYGIIIPVKERYEG